MESINHNGATYSKYVAPKSEDILERIEWLKKQLIIYFEKTGGMPEDYDIDLKLLSRSFIRLDQRMLHYKMYYAGRITCINELKFIAILCYWIMRYHVITVKNGTHTHSSVNEHFCIFLIVGTISKYRANNNLPKFNLKPITDDMFYHLRNRQISYDSMVLLVESMAKTF